MDPALFHTPSLKKAGTSGNNDMRASVFNIESTEHPLSAVVTVPGRFQRKALQPTHSHISRHLLDIHSQVPLMYEVTITTGPD
ncbi:uncharacterized protein ARMOST_15145 [Armillaria ostoyae]|uniref:Uncharacterized protein n=1 Tax=Armillaria ostoyae TaxID=47428 RepID=A0A284RSJ4_ARMOS|nr:uncharacterized protein ARMOST_15145 [Armillaria ostoyae]